MNYLTNASNSNNIADSAIVTDSTGNVRLNGGFLELNAGKLAVNNNMIEVTNDNINVSNGDIIVTDGNITTNQDVISNRMFVANDVSFNKNLYVKENLIVDGNVSLKQYNNEYIVNTHTTNYDLIVAEDLSVNGNLFINNDTSLNGDLYVAGSIAGTLTTPAQSNITSVGSLTSLALSGHITPSSHGTINMGTDSLKFNEIHGVTASLNTINVVGDISLNNRLFVGGDSSLNGQLYVAGTMEVNEDASLNRLFVPSIIVNNDISFAPNVGVVHQF